jgi:hypothetical protein
MGRDDVTTAAVTDMEPGDAADGYEPTEKD